MNTLSQVIQPVRNITEISGFCFVPFFFLNEGVDLLLKTRTKAKFWSGFSFRGLNLLLSSLSRKEFVGGHENACRNHQAMEEKPLGCAFGKQLSEPRTDLGLRVAAVSSVTWKPLGKLGSFAVQNCAVPPSSEVPRLLLPGLCLLQQNRFSMRSQPRGRMLLLKSHIPCWSCCQADSWSSESTLPLFRLAARESERLLTLPVPVSQKACGRVLEWMMDTDLPCGLISFVNGSDTLEFCVTVMEGRLAE